MANSEGGAIGPNPRTGCDPGHDAVCVLGRRAGRLVGRRAQSGLDRKVTLLEAWARPPHPETREHPGPSSPRRPGAPDDQASGSESGVDREGAGKMRPPARLQIRSHRDPAPHPRGRSALAVSYTA